MPETIEPEYLSTASAARLLDLPERTLLSWRAQHVGPAYVKIGTRLVRYRRADLLAFAESSAGKRLGTPTPARAA